MMRNTGLAMMVCCVVYCSCAYAVVENDNVLKGVLREDGYAVIQDIGEMTARQPDKTSLILSVASDGYYRISSKLDTMSYADTRRAALTRFTAEQNKKYPSMQIKLSPNRNYIEVTRTFKRSVLTDAARNLLDTWQQQLAKIKQALVKTMTVAGPDGKGGSSCN